MKKLKPGTCIETKKWVYVVLWEETDWESYMCIKTPYDFGKIQFEEILRDEIEWYIRPI